MSNRNTISDTNKSKEVKISAIVVSVSTVILYTGNDELKAVLLDTTTSSEKMILSV